MRRRLRVYLQYNLTIVFVLGFLSGCAHHPTAPLVWEKLNVADEAEFTKLVNRRQSALAKMYVPRVDPYFGRVSLGPTCDPDRIPRPTSIETPDASIRASFAYATNEKFLGVCSVERDKLKLLIVWGYCRRSNLGFAAEIFSDAHGPWATPPKLPCPSTSPAAMRFIEKPRRKSFS